MLVKPSHIVLTATLALSAATAGLAHSHSSQNDLERRGYDILEAYQHASRGLGAFDDEELDARDSSSDSTPSGYQRREELISELATRFRNVLDKRSPIIDSHGYGHAWREQQSLQKRSIFPHDEKMISSIQTRIKSRRAKEKARKAKAAKARQDALEEIERRAALEELVLAARELAEEEELSARGYDGDELFEREPEFDEDEYLAARELVEAAELAIRDEEVEDLIQQARSWLEEQEELDARELEPEDDLDARDFLEKLIHDSRELAEEEQFAARDPEGNVEGLIARALAEDEELLSRDFLHAEELDARDLEELLVEARGLIDEEEFAVRDVAEHELDARELEDLLKARELASEEELDAREVETLLVKARELAEEEELVARELVEGDLDARGPAEEDLEAREAPSEGRVQAREESAPNVAEARELVTEEAISEARDLPAVEDNTKREVEPDIQLEAREPEPAPATNAETPAARELEEPIPVEAREPSPAVEEPAPVEARAPEVGDILAEREPEAEPAPPLAARVPEPTLAAN